MIASDEVLVVDTRDVSDKEWRSAKPAGLSDENWGSMSPAMRERAQIWHELTEAERRFIVEDEVALYLAWRRREIERLDGLIEAGAMDGWDEQIDAHRKEATAGVEADTVQPPSGAKLPRPPVNGHGEQWMHRVYDFMAARTEWVSIPQMIEAFDVPHHSVYAGVESLQRLGLVIEGPSVVAESGRRVKRWAIRRERKT